MIIDGKRQQYRFVKVYRAILNLDVFFALVNIKIVMGCTVSRGKISFGSKSKSSEFSSIADTPPSLSSNRHAGNVSDGNHSNGLNIQPREKISEGRPKRKVQKASESNDKSGITDAHATKSSHVLTGDSRRDLDIPLGITTDEQLLSEISRRKLDIHTSITTVTMLLVETFGVVYDRKFCCRLLEYGERTLHF